MVRENSRHFEEGQHYVVEKILNKKVSKSGEHLYYVKWKGRVDEDNTWENLDALDCDDLIEDFEKRLKDEASKTTERSENKENEEKIGKYGFDRGLEPVRIMKMGRTDDDKSVFRMLWNDGTQETVPTDLAKDKCPQLVIEFYQNLIEWRKLPTVQTQKRRESGHKNKEENRKKRAKKMRRV